jgi:hypothetical protein
VTVRNGRFGISENNRPWLIVWHSKSLLPSVRDIPVKSHLTAETNLLPASLRTDSWLLYFRLIPDLLSYYHQLIHSRIQLGTFEMETSHVTLGFACRSKVRPPVCAIVMNTYEVGIHVLYTWALHSSERLIWKFTLSKKYPSKRRMFISGTF